MKTRAHRTILTASIAAGMLATSALPSFGADSATLAGEVTIPAPCVEITFDNDPTVPTGLTPFGTPNFALLAEAQGSHFLWATDGTATDIDVDVSNCGENDQNFSVVGTDATSTTTSLTWDLVDWYSLTEPCDPDANPVVNAYGLNAITFDSTNASMSTPILTTASPVEGGQNVTPGGTIGDLVNFTINYPCVGSDGAGETMTFDLTVIAEVT